MKLLKLLQEMNFTGPVGLQCYKIKGEDAVDLEQSMEGWDTLKKSLAK